MASGLGFIRLFPSVLCMEYWENKCCVQICRRQFITIQQHPKQSQAIPRPTNSFLHKPNDPYSTSDRTTSRSFPPTPHWGCHLTTPCQWNQNNNKSYNRIIRNWFLITITKKQNNKITKQNNNKNSKKNHNKNRTNGNKTQTKTRTKNNGNSKNKNKQ